LPVIIVKLTQENLQQILNLNFVKISVPQLFYSNKFAGFKFTNTDMYVCLTWGFVADHDIVVACAGLIRQARHR
jgi:hypothetical protein